MDNDANLYVEHSNELISNFFRNFRPLLPFGGQVIMLSFTVVDNLPFLKQLFSAFLTKYFKRFQKTLENLLGDRPDQEFCYFFLIFVIKLNSHMNLAHRILIF